MSVGRDTPVLTCEVVGANVVDYPPKRTYIYLVFFCKIMDHLNFFGKSFKEPACLITWSHDGITIVQCSNETETIMQF